MTCVGGFHFLQSVHPHCDGDEQILAESEV